MIINEERFLQRYFEAELVFGNNISSAQRRSVFCALADVYGVSEKRRDELFALAEDPALRQVDSDAGYKRQKRIKQYAQEYGLDYSMLDAATQLLDVKGKAISALLRAGIVPGAGQTASDVASGVAKAARSGRIAAMFISALMSFEGVLVKKDRAQGRRTLAKLAMWTSPDAQLLGLKYDVENAREYASRLEALTVGLPDHELCDVALQKLPDMPFEDAGMRILRKAVEKGFAKAELYNSAFARVAHSGIIPLGDKQRVLLSGNDNLVRAVSNLPLKLSKKEVKVEDTALKTSFGRVAEQNKVARALSSALRCDPVCFECDDALLLKEYGAAIEGALKNCNVKKIKLSGVEQAELAGDLDNVFLRDIAESAPNVFLVFADADCPMQNLEAALNFFDRAKRARFKVRNLGVELDLTSVCVIMFASGAVKSALQGHATVVRLCKFSDDEKQAFLSGEVARLAEEGKFGEALTLSAEARDKLSAMDLEQSSTILEHAARHAYIEGSSVISSEHIEQSYEELGMTQGIGFGSRN